ncbi:MAG: pyroglutamyl-peptidase I [Nesterenkonia sp.]|uniref:pyroglutamyl-peptidase I family protein n=1 Tax=Nesterenkonia marinintestina TaxID=2979865 RepID=UPI0021C13BFB|nr:pyroglutamyl-peptidase I [Nesterenkonia sp. GX14115]MDO5493188.1 pyroglutamyl-peptidase I [Nesterenkonia sp.]
MSSPTAHEPMSASAPRRILITGFEPFDGADRNPSWDLADELRRRADRGVSTVASERSADGESLELHTLLLPVEFGPAGTRLRARLDELAAAGEAPDLVVALGLAAGTEAVALERVGLNLRDARIPDNGGTQPIDEPVVDGGPEARFATLRLKASLARIAAAEIPVHLSLSAGTFVCNDVLYTLLDHLDRTGADARGGFVHVPDLHSPDSPVTFDQAVQAVEMLLAESLHPIPDAVAAAGALH